MRPSLILLALAMLAASCADFGEPEALDPTPVLGCYTTQEAPSLEVDASAVTIGGEATVPYRYFQAKAGMILELPVAASHANGTFEFVEADTHFYRVIFRDGKPTIRVAFGPNGILRDYQRQEAADCRG